MRMRIRKSSDSAEHSTPVRMCLRMHPCFGTQVLGYMYGSLQTCIHSVVQEHLHTLTLSYKKIHAHAPIVL
jgi:hypothetical protein